MDHHQQLLLPRIHLFDVCACVMRARKNANRFKFGEIPEKNYNHTHTLTHYARALDDSRSFFGVLDRSSRLVIAGIRYLSLTSFRIGSELEANGGKFRSADNRR